MPAVSLPAPAALATPDAGTVIPLPAFTDTGAAATAAPSPVPPAVPAAEPVSLRTPIGAAVAPPSDTAVAAVAAQDERLVRTALSRYEAAYTQLNASSVSAVWPTVDRRALTRAFDGLASQEVSLGQCGVRIKGQTAQAECTGTARWTPKVGGGAQTAERRWRFDLRNTGSDWVIASATVR
jgi:hypothetical protein